MTQTETKPIEELEAPCCDTCGGSLEAGYETRDHGTDRETGYHDYELLCGVCAAVPVDDSPEYDEDTEAYYAAGDEAFTAAFEMGEL